jgi:hypothetical protein
MDAQNLQLIFGGDHLLFLLPCGVMESESESGFRSRIPIQID